MNSRLNYIVDRCLSSEATPDERAELHRLVAMPEHEEQAKRLLSGAYETNQGTHDVNHATRDAILEAIYRSTDNVSIQTGTISRRLWLRLTAAAAILLFALAGTWLFWQHDQQEQRLEAIAIAPGGNRATLTLADGRTIDLSEAQHGIVVGDGITYLDGSAVVGEQVSMGTSEQGADSPHAGLTTYDLQLTTPKGGTYQISLPDGTKVWLNAASTLRYTNRFDDERVVELTGEAYFDVGEQVHKLPDSQAHKFTRSQKIPFKVISNGQVVEVLGTQFNVSAYANEPEAKTTLVEGSVKLASAVTTKVLTPGQQATVRGADMEVKTVDVKQYTAWIHGDIVFDQADLPAIFRQLERWYDVSFDFGNIQPQGQLYGKLSRQANLSEILRVIQRNTDLKFTIEDTREGERRVRVHR